MRTTQQTAHTLVAEARLRGLTAMAAIQPPAAGPRGPAGPPPSFGAPYVEDQAEEEPSIVAMKDEVRRRVRERLAATTPPLDPGTPGLRVLIVLGVIAAVVAGIFAWRSRPVAEPIAPPMPASFASAVATPSPTSSVVVYVTGKVRKPGVLTLATGSRVADALKAAGGVRRGAEPGAVNLARRLVDGEQIVVGEPAPPGHVGGEAAPQAGGLVNLNLATAEQLNSLPGVGEVLAQRITEFREAHGGFQSVEQLREVAGIGEKKFAEIKDKATV
ncbi:hypothetical protein Pth03_34120 [Planotetraspora thailandica]|uniref:Helix-hairpin-helix DNA-binding motif class 1 domain-containing protein n=1 Tax=Planotetraspora thailandica TaxID=487172 RepID=A0A8J3XYU7_9ACTN|nr:ComEA family DNA-binding protein [Planotetraspora thailandica]GII55023.1 hypothetical protein Pth03_34120 [Planotetraspora thailandica]